MEKFLLKGRISGTTKVLQLSLPHSKKFEYVAVKNGEETLQTKVLLSEAIKRSKVKSTHVKPVAVIEGESCLLSKTLQHLLSGHPYPVSQGPVILPIDMNTKPSSPADYVLRKKMIFTHVHDQDCATWVPEVTGIDAWTKEDHIYDVSGVKSRIQGAASMRNMGIVYTCHMSHWAGCVIHCPCSICVETKEHCRNARDHEPCEDCTSQCCLHQVKLPRLFDPENEQYTIVTDELTKYRFARGYAGIPRSCDHCSKDLLEHQVLHLVWHVLCRFCRHDMKPLCGNVLTVADFVKTSKSLLEREERTCSVCLNKSSDKNARLRHESLVHAKDPQKYECQQCDKSYSNINALTYHVTKHQEDVVKPCCVQCGSQFSSSDSLAKHLEFVHHEGAKHARHECDVCGKSFTLETNLKRHDRESHFGSKFNIDYYEGYKPLAIFECRECDMKFKRSSDLKRHTKSAHSKTTFQCNDCERSFSRKDSLNRHVKLKHE